MKRRYNSRYILVAMLIVMAIVVTLIVAALVYKKSQHQSSQHSSDSSTWVMSVSDRDKKTASAMQEACAPIEKICFRYPKGWSIAIDQKDGGDVVVVQDAGRTLQLALDTGLAGIDAGQCEPGEMGVVRVMRSVETGIEVAESATHEHSVDRISAVALLHQDKQTKRYTIRLMLTANKTAATLGEHDGCETRLAQFVNGQHKKLANGEQSLLSFASGRGVHDTTSQVASVTFARPEDAEKALSLRTYSQAFDILASAHYQ